MSVMYDTESKYVEEFNANLAACRQEFHASYGATSTTNDDLVCVCAPGRVNLIGEHIDYNDGFVLPMAIPLYTIIVGRRRHTTESTDATAKTCRVKSLDVTGDYVEFSLDNIEPGKHHQWSNYVIGVCAFYQEANAGAVDSSFDAVVKSNVPMGSGLSSSAALEVATYTFLEHLFNRFASDKKQKALACQKAEHVYASVPCGIMDQFISTMGVHSHALLIDCRSLDSEPISFTDPDIVVLVTNSNVKHELEGSEYSSRRQMCEEAAKRLGKTSLRDANISELDAKKTTLSDEAYRRARHAISEIERTARAAEMLKANDMVTFGVLMNQSHDSLRDDFNVSCAELDELVELARATNGVLGSRMTGGGFGGCTVTLVRHDNVAELIQNIKANYKGKPSFYVCKPCEGARRITS